MFINKSCPVFIDLSHCLTKINEYGTTFINKHANFLGLGHSPMSPWTLGCHLVTLWALFLTQFWFNSSQVWKMSSETGIFDHFLTKINEYGTTFINKHAPFLGLEHSPMSPWTLAWHLVTLWAPFLTQFWFTSSQVWRMSSKKGIFDRFSTKIKKYFY